jgi:hypothetical protein
LMIRDLMLSIISVEAKRGETLVSELPSPIIKIESSRVRMLLKCSLTIVRVYQLLQCLRGAKLRTPLILNSWCVVDIPFDIIVYTKTRTKHNS